MNKREFIWTFAKENLMTKQQSEKIVNLYMKTIQKTLVKGEDVKISGFGRWFVNHRKAKSVCNPQTGEFISVESFKLPTFKPSKAFKNILNDHLNEANDL